MGASLLLCGWTRRDKGKEPFLARPGWVALAGSFIWSAGRLRVLYCAEEEGGLAEALLGGCCVLHTSQHWFEHQCLRWCHATVLQ